MSDALIGRTEELRLAIADLTGPSPARIFVAGVPGVGKTAFLRAVLDDPAVVARFGSRRFYVTTAGAATADAFVMRVSVALDETQPSMVHGVVVERLSQQLTLLAIDDADVASHADALGFDELMSRLTKTAGLSLVVAARGRMTSISARWTRILTLKPLHHDHARELLIRNAGGAITRDDQVEQLLNHAGQLPLAV